MAGVKYWNSSKWVDFEDSPTLIKKWDGSKWVDGESSSSPIINSWNGNAWVQLFPKQVVEVTTTFTASNLAYMHTSNTNTWTQGYVKGGTYEGRKYTGWLNLKSPGITNTDSLVIKDITANYERNGVGSWTVNYPMELSNSTLTSVSGSGTNAHNSKISTMTSDTGMVSCGGLSVGAKGTTTFNSANSKAIIKEWLTTSSQTLVYGSIQEDAVYTSLNSLELVITYETASYLATFKTDSSSKTDTFTMNILEEEMDMSLEEIINRRKELGIVINP